MPSPWDIFRPPVGDMVGEFAEIGTEGFELVERLRPPQLEEIPAPTRHPPRHRSVLRDLALLVAATPLVLGTLVGTAQLGSAASMNSLRVDTRSALEVDYGAWEAAEFAAVSPSLMDEVLRDQSRFPGIYAGAASPMIVPGEFWRVPFEPGGGANPHPAASSKQETGESISVRATIHLLWGALSLQAGSNEYLEDVGGQSALPLLVVVDARGNGAGWHLAVRATEEAAEESGGGPDVSRFELSLPNANIRSIDGYVAPSSLVTLPAPLSEADQVVAEAEPGEGMGTFGLVPSIFEVTIGRGSRGAPVLVLDLSLIASP